MKKIKSVSVSAFRVEEDFGFLKLIVSETVHLPLGGDGLPTASERSADTQAYLKTAVDNLKQSFDNFDDALKDSTINMYTAATSEADRARDTAWRSAHGYIKSMVLHPTDDVRRVALEAKAIFDKYGDPTSVPRTEKSGILHNLLQDLKQLDDANLNLIHFSPWLKSLDECEDTYLEAVAQRTMQQAARRTGIVKIARMEADTAYRTLVELVNALVVVNGVEDYEMFIDLANAIIDNQKTVLRARETNNSKKKEIREVG